MIRKILNWIASDGLLHIAYSALIVLTVLYLTDILWLSCLISLTAGVCKEYRDVYIEKDNNWIQAHHDLVCDIIGIAYGIVCWATLQLFI